MTTTDTTTTATDDGPEVCPAWCDVPDHADRDGSDGSHSAHGCMVELSLHPYTATDPDEHPDDLEVVMIGLDRDAGAIVPHVTLVPRSCTDEMYLTPDEADEIAAALTLMARKCRAQIEEDQMLMRLGRALADQL